MSTTIKANEDGAYTVNNDDLIPLVDNAGAVPKSVRPLQLYEGSKSNTEVVSQNGKSLQDAIDIINARGNPIIVSFTGTTIFSNYAIQEDNSGTSLLAYTGRRGYARIDNVTELAPLIECFISGPGIILFKEELPISYISKTIDIYFPQHSLIQFQPGELHTISADLILPSFTTLYCVDKNVCNIEIGIDTSLKIPKHANEIHFRGVKLASYNEPPALFTGQRQIEFLSGDSNALQFLTNFSVEDCILHSGHVDGLFSTLGDNSIIGGLKVVNSKLTGYSDVFAIKQARALFIENNELISQAWNVAGTITDTAAVGITIGASVSQLQTEYPKQDYHFMNNSVYADSIADGRYAAGIEFFQLAPTSKIIVKNNVITANARVGDTNAYGIVGNVSATQGVGATPGSSIQVINNTFDLNKSGLGINTDIMSTMSNHPIKYRNNHRIDDLALNIGINATVATPNET